MKRLATLVAVFVLAAGSAWAGEMVGWITDQQCAKAGNYAGDEHKKCFESGANLVFVNEADNKIYKLGEPEKAKPHIGQKVVLQGSAEGDTVQVQSITPAKS